MYFILTPDDSTLQGEKSVTEVWRAEGVTLREPDGKGNLQDTRDRKLPQYHGRDKAMPMKVHQIGYKDIKAPDFSDEP